MKVPGPLFREVAMHKIFLAIHDLRGLKGFFSDFGADAIIKERIDNIIKNLEKHLEETKATGVPGA